jgi:aarF domain-containing kinase
VEEAFAHFEPTPIAAASLAQVHRARTADEGLTVAVKVQYPALARQVAADLRTVRVLVALLGYAFEGHSYDWLLPEFEGSIRAELDFRLEAANAARTAAFFAYEPRLHVPR